MIITRKKHIPFSWIVVAIAPWAACGFAGGAMANTFLFSLKKFVENPAGLTLILTLPSYISIFLFPICSFLSDRIWTRFGRRKPFLIVAWTGMITALFLMPFMPSLGALIAVYMLFCISSDIGAPLEALKQEIVPPHQRGLATAGMQWIANISGLLFAFVAIGRFDDVSFMSGHQVTGETLIYWGGFLVLLVTFLLLLLAIKEINPKSPLVGTTLSVRTFFTAILDRDLWPVYTLIFGAAMLGSGLGPLGNLLYTDQWNYSKQEMGTNIAVGGAINIFVIGGLAFIADRLDRMRAYQTLITLSLFIQLFYYIYVEFLLPDRRPSLVEIIVFGETLSILGLLTSMIYVPLVYDYIVRDKMGTYSAGAGLLNKLTGIITLNAIGLFVSAYAFFFQPPAGEMARVCFDHVASSAEVASAIQKAAWSYPEKTPATRPDVTATPWYSTGVVRRTGSCWEIRLRDKTSERMSTEIEDLQGNLDPILAREKMLRDDAQIDDLQRKPKAALADRKQAEASRALIDASNGKIAPLQVDLAKRGDNFERQVLAAFAPDLLREGDQITSARVQDALVVTMLITRTPDDALEKTLVDLRRRGLGVIDLRFDPRQKPLGVNVSALVAPGGKQADQIRRLATTLTELANNRDPNLFSTLPQVMNVRHSPAVVLDLTTVEEPLDQHASPITSVVNALLALVDRAPTPEHRLAATARSLRQAHETEYVGIEPGPDQANSIRVVALLADTAPQSPIQDAITQRMQTLLGSAVRPGVTAQVRAFYDRLVDAAAVETITIQQPILDHGYVSMRYDYMSGYIPIFLLGLVGLWVTFAFARREKRGLIRKLGVEEAEAT